MDCYPTEKTPAGLLVKTASLLLLLAASAMLLLSPFAALAAPDDRDALPEVRVPQIAAAHIQPDGLPTPEAWAGAASLALTNYWAASNAASDADAVAAAERTQVRLLHSRTHLFVLFVCEDGEIIVRRTDRDDHTFRDDCAEIFLAAPLAGTLHESVNIEVSASGAWADVLFRMPNWINYDWNPSGIKVKVERTATGWNAQVALAFAELPLITSTNGYDAWGNAPVTDFARAGELLSVFAAPAAAAPAPVAAAPARLRANFSRWHRPQGQLSVWSNPNTPVPHPLVLDAFGWLVFEGSPAE